MGYAEMLSETAGFMRDDDERVYTAMCECTEMADYMLNECKVESEVEEAFITYGFADASLKARTSFLLYIMGYSDTFGDMSAMPRIYAEHRECIVSRLRMMETEQDISAESCDVEVKAG